MSSVPRLPRRAVLAGALAPLAGRPAETVPSADVTSPAALEIRRLASRAREAIDYECSLEIAPFEYAPGYAEARARSAELTDEIKALAEAIWSKPVRSWADVIERAEVAEWYSDREPFTNRLGGITSESPDERAKAFLLEAVLKLAGHPDV
jgi:hypothetical protein